MGRRSVNGGVSAKGTDRIEFTFFYQDKRYRPTLTRAPKETHLRRARVQLDVVKKKNKAGTFLISAPGRSFRISDIEPNWTR